MYVVLEKLHSDVVISTPRKTLSCSSEILFFLESLFCQREPTYVIVIEEEIHMGRGRAR